MHAARTAAAASRAPVDDDEGGRPATSDDGTHFSGGCALHRDEHRASAYHHCYSGNCDLVTESSGVNLFLEFAYEAKLAGRPPKRHLRSRPRPTMKSERRHCHITGLPRISIALSILMRTPM